jgi:hypothetical protein
LFVPLSVSASSADDQVGDNETGHRGEDAENHAERSLRELLELSKVVLILGCFAGLRPSGTTQGVMTMISSILLNLIVSIAAVGVLVFVLRVAHLAAGGQFEEAPARVQVDTAYDFERAA